MDDVAPVVAPGLPVVEAILATALVLALLLASSWFLRRRWPSRAGGGAMMSIETSLPLGDRRSLVIVVVDGHRLLIGLAPGQVRLVADLSVTTARPPATGAGR